ncbi:MAG: pyruvate dehydrogenase complex dihydrolipoamide acetyltransferase [Paracoccaceae bacterium]
MAIEVLMPALSPTMEDGTLAKWFVKEGDKVEPGDLLAEIETDKATMEFEAVEEGIIEKLLVSEGTEGVKVNSAIATLSGEDNSTSKNIEEPAASNTLKTETSAINAKKIENNSNSKSRDRVFITPLARRIAEKKGIDINLISGTGPHGRIIKKDLVNLKSAPLGSVLQDPDVVTAKSISPNISDSFSYDALLEIYADRNFTEIALDGMRKTIAARLSEAKQTIPHFYLRRSVKMANLLDFKQKINKKLSDKNIKVSINDIIIKACSEALQSNPDANAIWAGNKLIKFESADIAVAVSVEGGLFTPVIKDTDQKTISNISEEMKDLASRARAKKLMPTEFQGGSFAISNLGMFGIESFDAIINPPHAAILAVGTGKKKPVVSDDGSLGAATEMELSLSVDHRVIDGVLGAQLLHTIVDNLENPIGLLNI